MINNIAAAKKFREFLGFLLDLKPARISQLVGFAASLERLTNRCSANLQAVGKFHGSVRSAFVERFSGWQRLGRQIDVGVDEIGVADVLLEGTNLALEVHIGHDLHSGEDVVSDADFLGVASQLGE